MLGKVLDRLEVLDVDGGDDVDAGGENVLDVLIPLGVTDTGHVGVCELVHEHHLRVAGEDGIKVHLLHEAPVILDLKAWNDFEVPDRLLGELATVGLDVPDDHVFSLRAAVVRLAEHGERLAASRCGPEEHPEVATPDLGCRRDRHRGGGDRVGHTANDARLDRSINAFSRRGWPAARRVRG